MSGKPVTSPIHELKGMEMQNVPNRVRKFIVVGILVLAAMIASGYFYWRSTEVASFYRLMSESLMMC
ncbi:hypothetical protein [Vibrio cincinnatiensis]|uniref:hypothetical protein n=1 Tax=Vibrio cincinnatiensis TaxID=675 RepID=UPI001EDF6E04|nr:hypothetical protein [Vibrio cincinnatiensis]MCG3728461.1 hypothetical protein [Vibrio cincinnatiensis]